MAEDPAYQSLYRKYRPQSPEDVVGQEHVVRALVGAVREGRLSHAFLFCGPRGTGKTSTARILAKMVNCEKGPTPEPCGVCEQCVAIREGTHLDVVEIDAASHGGVDDARELRERAPTAPAMGREKVYILDEAQRLSREAFDALLKIFEEPPPGVRFILATTEPHKMPATIVSRTQRFDFRRISTEMLADLVERVAKEEGIAIDRRASETIARVAEGSAREAEKLLDQTALLGGGEVTPETVMSLLGAPQADAMFELADAIALGDTKGVFEVVERLVQEGNDLRHFTGQALGHFRDLLLVRSAPEEPAVMDASPEQHQRLAAQAAKFSTADLSRILSLLVAAQTDMRWTTSPRLTLELALVRSAIPEADPSPSGLAARIERLERLSGMTPGGEAVHSEEPKEAVAGPVEPEGEPSPKADPVEEPAQDEIAPDAPHAPDASSLDVMAIRRSWPTFLQKLTERRQPVLRANLESVTAAAWDGTTLELAFPPGKRFAVGKVQSKEDDFRQVFAEVFGVQPKIRCVARDAAGPLTEVAEDDEPTPSTDDAVARLKAELGAEVEPAPDAGA